MKLSLTKLLEIFEACNATIKIFKNHGHKMIISTDDITLGEERRYDIQGASSHSHVVDLTVDDFARLSSTETLILESNENNAHTHKIKITCRRIRSDHPNPDQLRTALIPVDAPDRKKGY